MIYDDEHMILERVPDSSTLRLVRNDRPYESLEAMERSFEAAIESLSGIDRGAHGLLIDTRDAPGRSDAEFEERFAPLRSEIMRGFRRVAVVLKTQVGVMQARRHAEDDGSAARPFTDADRALAWLSGS